MGGRWEEGRRKDGRTEGTQERENEERKGDGSRGATSELVLWPAYTCTHMCTPHTHTCTQTDTQSWSQISRGDRAVAGVV